MARPTPTDTPAPVKAPPRVTTREGRLDAQVVDLADVSARTTAAFDCEKDVIMT